jgi:hypothetical protein
LLFFGFSLEYLLDCTTIGALLSTPPVFVFLTLKGDLVVSTLVLIYFGEEYTAYFANLFAEFFIIEEVLS